MPISRFDQIYRSVVLSKFFTKGWGSPENIKRLIEFRHVVHSKEKCNSRVPKDYPVVIDKHETHADYILLEGHFKSPFANYLPEVVPSECETAYFQVLLPKKWKTRLKPICLHLAGTGDHYFWRRRTLLAKPLLKEAGIGSIILENPFYGLRKPKDQTRSSLHNVSDIFVMGGCLAFESTVLFNWCEQEGLGPLGVTGISMGGHMASIAACVWPKPIALIPCLSWTTASCVFTQGVMSDAIPWQLLENQYLTDWISRKELHNMICDPNHVNSFDMVDRHQLISGVSEPHQPTQIAGDLIGRNSCSPKASGILLTADAVDRTGVDPSVATGSTRDQGSLKSKRRGDKASYVVAQRFMSGMMDEFTHLASYSPPVDPNLVIIVVAKDDGYVLRDGIDDLSHIWPGAEVRYVDAGHIAAFLFKQSVFRKAIVDAFDRIATKYYTKV